MLRLGEFGDRIIAKREIAARPARYGEFPAGLDENLVRAVQAQGFEKLYSHQAEMIEKALAGRDCVITTGTASGKSLAYLLPILQTILERPESRAILLFPTKALAQDQLRGVLDLIEPLGASRVQAGVYDGDTPPVERKRIRERCHLILTNPDMLNSAYLPNHGRRGFSREESIRDTRIATGLPVARLASPGRADVQACARRSGFERRERSAFGLASR